MKLQIAAFNHVLNQHPAVRDELARFSGRRVSIQLPPLAVSGVFTEDGWLAACEGEPEAVIRLKHSVALATLSGRQPDLADVTLEGDTDLATAVARLVGGLKWDAAEDLSRVVGDVAASRLEKLARGVLGVKGEIAWRLAENWIEHLREEAPLLAKKPQVDTFVHAVDTLRDDAARLEKRLAALEAAVNPKNS
nr:sterol-binding protein [uncultured Pseudogulbenkiania sp.]